MESVNGYNLLCIALIPCLSLTVLVSKEFVPPFYITVLVAVLMYLGIVCALFKVYMDTPERRAETFRTLINTLLDRTKDVAWIDKSVDTIVSCIAVLREDKRDSVEVVRFEECLKIKFTYRGNTYYDYRAFDKIAYNNGAKYFSVTMSGERKDLQMFPGFEPAIEPVDIGAVEIIKEEPVNMFD